MKQTDTLKRLNAVMKDINGDKTQILRALQDQIDYLQEKVSILVEILEEETGKEQPVFSKEQKRRLAYRGRKLNEYLLSVIEPTFAPGTIQGWYRELIAKKYDSTGTGQRKRGRKPISAEIVEKILEFWTAKLTRNRNRDEKEWKELIALGWGGKYFTYGNVNWASMQMRH